MLYTKEIHDEIIRKSHKRSLEYGIEKERVESKRILKGKEISSNIHKNSDLIRIAFPFTRNLYEILKGSGFLIILTDNEGCILDVIGDENVVNAAKELNMVVGAYMDEKSIGTNAMGTAIKENMPIQISATEHFINAYHKWTCSAAPIHDTKDNIIGTLNLTGHSDEVHPHTLGLALAAVMSIENQLKIENVQEKLLKSYLYMNTMMNSITYGILAVDMEGIIQNCNTTACKMFNVKEQDILYTQIKHIVKGWSKILKHINMGKKYENEEVSIKGSSKFSLTVNPIKDENEKIIGSVLVLNEIQRVLNLVNKYSNTNARYTFEDYIYSSKDMKRIVDYAKDIADSPSTVLIQGESGTGKEILAQSIHNYSRRAEKPFVAINCGAIPKNLIESELFGYEEGAFTGAKRGGRPGKFELANGGTLFLDEIGEMPLDMQVNLLRVLQEGYIIRVGGNKIIEVNARIITATNKNLREEINKGTFREDLYYRLSVIPINLYPLRERREDIKPLAEHFLVVKSKKLNKPIPNISKELMNKIIKYDWPGNVRELENFIENVVNFGGNTTFNIENNNDNSVSNNINQINRNKMNYSGENASNAYGEHMKEEFLCNLEELETKAIKTCLAEYQGNVTKTAATLGISRNTLYLKMKKYNIKNEMK